MHWYTRDSGLIEKIYGNISPLPNVVFQLFQMYPISKLIASPNLKLEFSHLNFKSNRAKCLHVPTNYFT